MDKPLHVQVAECLGWSGCHDRGDGLWLGVVPASNDIKEVPHYDKTWCAAGPLVERFKISLSCDTDPDFPEWEAKSRYLRVYRVEADTPQRAICVLVLKIHKEGDKLTA